MRVLLARHGQTDWNAAGRIQGTSDIPLNERGREQARRLALSEELAGVETIYSSPLRRAMETAEIAAAALGVEVIPANELRELAFGCWEGLSWDGIAAAWPEQFAAYAADRRNYAPPGGESYAEMIARAGPFIGRLRRSPGGSALCVSHSAVMRGLLAAERGIDIGESYKIIRLPNGEISALESLI